MMTFVQYVTEDEHSALKRHVGAFFRQNPEYTAGLHDQDKSLNTCGKVSYKLAKHLKNNGIKASLIRGRHHLLPIEPDAHPAYHTLDPKRMFHFAVRSGKHVVDSTGSQFGKKYAGPQVMPMTDFKKRWKVVGNSNEWF